MRIVLHPDVSPEAQAVIEGRVRELGFTPHAISGAGRTAIGITGNKGAIDPGHFRELPGVADCIPVTAPSKLVSREVKPEHTVVDVAAAPVGGPDLGGRGAARGGGDGAGVPRGAGGGRAGRAAERPRRAP